MHASSHAQIFRGYVLLPKSNCHQELGLQAKQCPDGFDPFPLLLYFFVILGFSFTALPDTTYEGDLS